MAENFLFSINAVLPLFLTLALGFFMRVKGLLEPAVVRRMNALVFNLALPALLFRDIAGSDFRSINDGKLLIIAIVSTLLIFTGATLVANICVREKESRGAFIQGCFRGNYAILGLPLISNILGSANSGKAAAITTFVIPLYNVLAILILSLNGKDERQTKDLVKSSIVSIIKNPLIIGIFAGLPFSYFMISFPMFVNTTIGYLAGMATPLALLAIGASIDFKQPRGKILLAGIASSIKLVITPVIFIGLAILLGVRGESLVVLFVLYAAPTAVSSYIMADNLGNDKELAASIILSTSILSVITYTLGIFVLKSVKLI